MSIVRDCRISYSTFPLAVDGYDGAFAGISEYPGDGSGGIVQTGFYFGKPALEGRIIDVETWGFYMDQNPVFNIMDLVIYHWGLGPSIAQVPRTLYAVLLISGNVGYKVEATCMMPGKVRIAHGLPIFEQDVYSVIMQAPNINGCNYYMYLTGRWKLKPTAR